MTVTIYFLAIPHFKQEQQFCALFLPLHTFEQNKNESKKQQNVLPVYLFTLLSFILQSLTCLSSEPEMMSGRVGWKAAQLTPRSCPSRTWRTVASPVLKSSGLRVWWSSPPTIPPTPGDTFFLRRPETVGLFPHHSLAANII